MVKLKPFQLDGVRAIYNFRGRAILADEMGLGKGIQALSWIYKLPARRPAVIVVPSSVKYNWHYEALDHFGMRIDVIDGNRKKNHFPKLNGVIVINYDILHSWLPAFERNMPQIVILDESQFCKSAKSRRTIACKHLSRDASSVVALSGTPMLNNPFELWAVLDIVRPDLFPSMQKFAFRYSRPRYTPWGWKYDGAANKTELRKILYQEVMIRRLSKDHLDLPDKTRQTITGRLGKTDAKTYAKASNFFIRWLRETSPSKARKAARSQALTRIGYLLRLASEMKLKWTTTWVKEFFECHPGEKLVLGTMHTNVVDHFVKEFPKGTVVINGKVTGKKRMENVRMFQTSEKVKLMVCNIVAGGIGINLFAGRHTLVHDLPWQPGQLQQFEKRTHRMGQTRECFIWYPILDGTIEGKLLKIILKKWEILDSILDGGKSGDDYDIFDEVLKELSGYD